MGWPDAYAKPSSPNYRRFVEQYGTKAVELDAAPVDLLQSKLRSAIEDYLNMQVFNEQLALEEVDFAQIEAHRRVVFAAIKT